MFYEWNINLLLSNGNNMIDDDEWKMSYTFVLMVRSIEWGKDLNFSVIINWERKGLEHEC
jgi:hypothetical protein